MWASFRVPIICVTTQDKKKTIGKFGIEFILINKLLTNGNLSIKLHLDYERSLCEKLTHDELNYDSQTGSDG